MKYADLKIGYLLATLFAGAWVTYADQPIMNEVPRWEGGYGVQVFQEWRWSDDLMRGRRDLPNPEDLRYEKRITHFEGVYTWRKWIRVTAKLPWVEQKRRIIDTDGSVRWQRSSGLDDAKLALPLRYYTNRPRYSGHFGIAPQIRFGGDDNDSFRVSDGSTDYGMSLTYERESPSIKISGDLTYWWEQDSGQEDDWSVDVGIGWNFHDRGALLWETEYIDEPDNYEWLGGGPTLFWNFNDLLMGRIEYKFALDERVDGQGLSRGDSLRIGLGLVF